MSIWCTFLCWWQFEWRKVIYQNSPADYIWNQNDGWFIDRHRQADIIFKFVLAWVTGSRMACLPSTHSFYTRINSSSLVCRNLLRCFMTDLYAANALFHQWTQSLKGGFLWLSIVISPYYPQNFQQFTVELANKGITVLKRSGALWPARPAFEDLLTGYLQRYT